MTDRRSRYAIQPRSGALLDNETLRWWMGEIERRERPVRVERLSDRDPFSMAVAAESRKRDAA